MWRVLRPDAQDALEDPGVRAALPRYVDIVKGRRGPRFLVSRSIEVEYSRRDDVERLWEIHDAAIEVFEAGKDGKRRPVKGGKGSLYDLKRLLAHRMMESCNFCVRNCMADRFHGERGYCGAGLNFSLFSAFPHMGEEPELVPSGTIFTGGCSMRCIHCQNWDISQWQGSGISFTPEMMAKKVEELALQRCRNINMVGGDPTPYVWHWLEAFNYVKQPIATIWNSNSYYSLSTAKLLAGFIDVYLLDFKYGNNDCAKYISDAPGYWEACTRNHLIAHKYGELIVRVLVLPGHNECCTRPILQWIHDNLGPMTRVNLMFQYRPEWRAKERPELGRRLNNQEMREARRMTQEIGLQNLVK